MTQPSRNWQAVAKEGRVKAPDNCSTRGWSESIMHHMGEPLSLRANASSKIGSSPCSFTPLAPKPRCSSVHVNSRTSRKGKADKSRQELEHVNQQLADIERDQTRLRANLKETPPTAAAYKKYLAKLDRQETEVDELREQIKRLRDQELHQRQQYDAFLASLDVE